MLKCAFHIEQKAFTVQFCCLQTIKVNLIAILLSIQNKNIGRKRVSSPDAVLYIVGILQAPGGAIFGVLDYEAEGSELIADEVAGGPVLVSLGLGTNFEQQVNGTLVGIGL